MKRRLALLALVFLLFGPPAHAGWFDNKDEKLLAQAQQQLETARRETKSWQIISSALAIGCMATLILGTALGSKARQMASKEEVFTREVHANADSRKP